MSKDAFSTPITTTETAFPSVIDKKEPTTKSTPAPGSR